MGVLQMYVDDDDDDDDIGDRIKYFARLWHRSSVVEFNGLNGTSTSSFNCASRLHDCF